MTNSDLSSEVRLFHRKRFQYVILQRLEGAPTLSPTMIEGEVRKFGFPDALDL